MVAAGHRRRVAGRPAVGGGRGLRARRAGQHRRRCSPTGSPGRCRWTRSSGSSPAPASRRPRTSVTGGRRRPQRWPPGSRPASAAGKPRTGRRSRRRAATATAWRSCGGWPPSGPSCRWRRCSPDSHPLDELHLTLDHRRPDRQPGGARARRVRAGGDLRLRHRRRWPSWRRCSTSSRTPRCQATPMRERRPRASGPGSGPFAVELAEHDRPARVAAGDGRRRHGRCSPRPAPAGERAAPARCARRARRRRAAVPAAATAARSTSA